MPNEEQQDQEDQRRLFFAFEVAAPWPEKCPKGRLLQSDQRHMTAAFIGRSDYSILQPLLSAMPLPGFKVGFAGFFNRIVFLPKAHPRVVAWHVEWLDEASGVNAYVHVLTDWLKEHGFNPDERAEFLPHVTLCRSPFSFHEWRDAFHKLPMGLTALHLYESVGGLQYKSLWKHQLLPPFEEIEHTADIAFKVHGESVSQIYRHAFCALAWKYPEILKHKEESWEVETVDDIVMKLNAITGKADAEAGCPFKAVSYHGEIQSCADGTLMWEMIVDV